MEKHSLRDYLALLTKRGLLVETTGIDNDLAEREVSLLTYNSGAAEPGTLFVAKGLNFKAAYLADALSRGAFAYVTDSEVMDRIKAHGGAASDDCAAAEGAAPAAADEGDAPAASDDCAADAPHITVTDIRLALSCMSAYYFGEPARGLTVVGIGGTKGKSSTTFFLTHILEAWRGSSPAYLSTIETYDGAAREVSHITTPESYEIHRHFRNAVDRGISEAVMEVSSQAFKVKRVPDVRFNIGIFTNISEDHISPIEHPDFEDYYRCKMEMFAQTDTALVNVNADLAERTLATARRDSGRVYTYGALYGRGRGADRKDEGPSWQGAEGAPDYYAYDIRKDGFATRFRMSFPSEGAHTMNDGAESAGTGGAGDDFVLTVPGLFNVENAAAAIAAAHLLGVPLDVIHRALPSARVPGRMELFHTADEKIIAIVDYAHNKLSFEKLFESARAEYPGRTVISVFGATGGKGVNRRYDLGSAAGRLADYAVITSDDPGPEEFAAIASGIKSAFEKSFAARGGSASDHYAVIEDRREAIRAAFDYAKRKCIVRRPDLPDLSDRPDLTDQPGAVILAAGRGRDATLKVGTEYIPYPSDVSCVEECISEYDLGSGR